MNANAAEYSCDRKQEKRIVRRVRRTKKRWVIGNVAAAVIAAAGIVLFIVTMSVEKPASDEILPLFLAVELFPVIGVFLCLAAARTVGRDILLNRQGEKVHLLNDRLVESYTPRHYVLDEARQYEVQMLYSDVVAIAHNRIMCRYELKGRCAVTRYTAGNQLTNEQTTTENDAVVLYEYFYSMDELLQTLTQKCGIQIQEI